MVKKKHGREVNPADAFRKTQRAKEVARNKKERQLQREAFSSRCRDDPGTLRQQLKEILKAEEDGPLTATMRLRKKTLQQAYDQAIKRALETDVAANRAVSTTKPGANPPSLTQLTADIISGGMPHHGQPHDSQASGSAEADDVVMPKSKSNYMHSLHVLPPLPSLPLPVSAEYRPAPLRSARSLASRDAGTVCMAPPLPGSAMPLVLPRFVPPSEVGSASLRRPATETDLHEKMQHRLPASIISKKSTVVSLPKAQHDASVTSLIPASVLTRRHPAKESHAHRPPCNSSGYGLVPAPAHHQTDGVQMRQTPENASIDAKYDAFLKSMTELGAIEDN